MEKVLKSYDKEFMRMAMLKHEETFREQVCELHRLYRIQKMLMKTTVEVTQKNNNCNNNNNEQNQGDCNERRLGQGSRDDRVGVGAADHAERIAESCNNHMEESDIELTLTLGPGRAPAHNPRLPRTDKSESGQSVSSSSTGSSQTRKASPKNGFKWGSESDPGFSNGQQNNPPWMFQALSLKLS